jgi:hypothetical protein
MARRYKYDAPCLAVPKTDSVSASLARVVRAAKKGGGERVEIDPQTGRYLVIPAKPGESKDSDTPEQIISKL